MWDIARNMQGVTMADIFEGGLDDLPSFFKDAAGDPVTGIGDALSNAWFNFTEDVRAGVDQLPFGEKLTGDHLMIGDTAVDGGTEPWWAAAGFPSDPTPTLDTSTEWIIAGVAIIVILVLIAYIAREVVG